MWVIKKNIPIQTTIYYVRTINNEFAFMIIINNNSFEA